LNDPGASYLTSDFTLSSKHLLITKQLITIYNHMKAENLNSSPKSSNKQQKDVIRNFQQLLKLKLMRE
jgi:hypothetical protein